MSKYLIVILLCSLLILPGCFIEDSIEEDIISDVPILGWIFFGSTGWHPKADTPVNDGSNWINSTITVKGNVTACPKNQYWDYRYGTCMCEADYYMQNGACISKASRECSVDRDCSPDGKLSTCADQYNKRMYYCNLNTYKCSRPIVDCRTEYGKDYRCVSGNCVNNLVK